eukprot:1160921-Pelagomonas_calceolata.AAC.3
MLHACTHQCQGKTPPYIYVANRSGYTACPGTTRYTPACTQLPALSKQAQGRLASRQQEVCSNEVGIQPARAQLDIHRRAHWCALPTLSMHNLVLSQVQVHSSTHFNAHHAHTGTP